VRLDAGTLVDIVGLADGARGGPCVSILMPTHRRFPEKRQDPVRFRNLVARAAETLRARSPRVEAADGLLGPLNAIVGDDEFWMHGEEGLAVFVAPGGVQRVLRTPCPLPEAAIVAERFAIRPLLRCLPRTGRFQVLCLTRRTVRLLEGDGDGVGEVELAPGVPRRIEDTIAAIEGAAPDAATRPGPPEASGGGQRGRGGTRTGAIDHRHGSLTDALDPDVAIFFRSVDRAIHERHSRPSGLPLVVVAVADNLGPFRALSRNPQRLDPGIEADPAALDDDALCERAHVLVARHEAARIDALVERVAVARARGLAVERIDEAAMAAREGRVETLLMADSPAVTEGATQGAAVAETDADDPAAALAEQVLRAGGVLHVVPAQRLAPPDRVAAILRYRA
jgi:hypothetical protein